MPNEKQSDLKFCQTPQVGLKNSKMKGVHLPVTLRWPGWDSGESLALSKDFFDCTKDPISLWECPLQGLSSHKGWQPARYGHNRCKTTIQLQTRIWGLGSGSGGAAARIAELHLHVWLIQPLLVSISKAGYCLCGRRILWSLKSNSTKYSGWSWESLLRNPASIPLLR